MTLFVCHCQTLTINILYLITWSESIFFFITRNINKEDIIPNGIHLNDLISFANLLLRILYNIKEVYQTQKSTEIINF